MRLRRAAGLIVLTGLLVVAGVAVWRSTQTRSPGTAGAIEAQLRCPACDGETVAQSQSPIAAAMRATIAQQLAAGRSPAQIRAWFVDRYGRGILAQPVLHGPGLVLWLVPGLVLFAACCQALRTWVQPAYRARAPSAPSANGRGASKQLARIWNLTAACLVGTVLAVAAGGHYLSAKAAAVTSSRPTATTSTDPTQARLAMAESLEQQGQYAAAADVYRQVNTQHPDDAVALKLAFVLVRAGQPEQAVPLAQEVLRHTADNPDALLVLGLAQRAAHMPGANATLRRYLAVAPQAPAAEEVRRLLTEQ